LDGHAGRVLIVEDDPTIRESITQVLVDESYQTRTAGDIATALSVSVELRPQLILLDVRLRSCSDDGVGILRNQMPYVAIVAMTALPDFGGDLVLEHVDATLAKPFDLEDLLATVERFCAETYTA
jgi:DNA-binding response OmpR family regulator